MAMRVEVKKLLEFVSICPQCRETTKHFGIGVLAKCTVCHEQYSMLDFDKLLLSTMGTLSLDAEDNFMLEPAPVAAKSVKKKPKRKK